MLDTISNNREGFSSKLRYIEIFSKYSEIAISSKIATFHKRIRDIFTTFVSLG